MIEYWPTKYPGRKFEMSAHDLQIIRDRWIAHGRSEDYDPDEFSFHGGEFFIFTNSFTLDAHVYKCRFGKKDPYWPPRAY